MFTRRILSKSNTPSWYKEHKEYGTTCYELEPLWIQSKTILGIIQTSNEVSW